MLMVWAICRLIGIVAEISEHALTDVIDIGSALTEVGVVDPSHRLQEFLHHCVKCKFCILLAIVDS